MCKKGGQYSIVLSWLSAGGRDLVLAGLSANPRVLLLLDRAVAGCVRWWSSSSRDGCREITGHRAQRAAGRTGNVSLVRCGGSLHLQFSLEGHQLEWCLPVRRLRRRRSRPRASFLGRSGRRGSPGLGELSLWSSGSTHVIRRHLEAGTGSSALFGPFRSDRGLIRGP